MNQLQKCKYIWLCLLMVVAASCKDKWEEHNGISDPNLTETLLDKIKADPKLSIFSSLVIKSHYDKELSSSKNYTVWAPSDDVLAGLSPAIINDSLALRSFVGNHITFNSYLTTAPKPFIQLKALNGKNVVFTSSSLDEINIVQPNQYVKNGVLHTLNGFINPKKNIYEFLLAENSASEMRDFVLSYNKKVFDPTFAEITGINPVTGKPIYKLNTDSVIVNSYVNSVKIKDENKLVTYVVLQNDIFKNEVDKISPFYATSTTDSTKALARAGVVKDLAFDGLYLPENLPDSLTSMDSVKVRIDKNAIVSSHRLSNGIVYILNRLDYKVPNKLKPVLIQGESTRTLSLASMANGTYTRRNPDGLTTYTQLRGLNFAAALSWYRYTPTLHSVKYKVYWRAVRDFDLTPGPSGTPTYFQQRIAFKTFNATDLNYVTVAAKEASGPTTNPKTFEPDFNEVYIGEYVTTRYGKENVFIVSNTVNTIGLNSIVLDYIKLVPVTN